MPSELVGAVQYSGINVTISRMIRGISVVGDQRAVEFAADGNEQNHFTCIF